MQKISEEAFMGIALVPVIDDADDDDPKVEIKYGKFNKARGVNEDFVKTMASMMSKNICYSGSNPLVATVDARKVDAGTLSKDYDVTLADKGQLRKIGVRGEEVEVEILNGKHRVLAAKRAHSSFPDTLSALGDVIDEVDQDLTNGKDLTAAERRRLEARKHQAVEDQKAVKETSQNILLWPTRLYDKGMRMWISLGRVAFTHKHACTYSTASINPNER
jgi:hypothetical protein